MELSDQVFKISCAIKRGGQKTRVIRLTVAPENIPEDCCGGTFVTESSGSIETGEKKKLNGHSTYGHIIEDFVQFMSRVKTSVMSEALVFSQTRV